MITLGDVIFYGGLFGVGVGIVIILYIGKKVGYEQLTHKHYLIAAGVAALFWLIPFWFTSIPIPIKIIATAVASLCGYANYRVVDHWQKRQKKEK